MTSTLPVSLIFIVLAVSHLTCAAESDQADSLKNTADIEDYIPLPRPYTSHRVQIQSNHHCFRPLYKAQGLRPGFKGWKQKGTSGYIVMNGYMYLFYRCDGQYSSHYSGFIPLPRPY